MKFQSYGQPAPQVQRWTPVLLVAARLLKASSPPVARLSAATILAKPSCGVES
jgi:hypothetical protein